MPDDFDINFTVFVREEDKLGIGQEIQISKNSVYKVAEVSPRGLITTSGRIGTTTLDETSDYIIANMGGRPVDWVIIFRGTVVRTVHPDDSITDPP